MLKEFNRNENVQGVNMKFFTLLEFTIVAALVLILFVAIFPLEKSVMFPFTNISNQNNEPRFKVEIDEFNKDLRGQIYTMVDSTDSSRYIVVIHPNGVAMVKQDR